MIARLFTVNCGGSFAFALGVTLTSAPSEQYSTFLRMDSFYEISCVSMILGNISNLIDYNPSSLPPKLPIRFSCLKFKPKTLFLLISKPSPLGLTSFG